MREYVGGETLQERERERERREHLLKLLPNYIATMRGA